MLKQKLQHIDLATDRFLAKAKAINEPLEAFSKTDQFAKFHKLLHKAIVAQAKFVAGKLPTLLKDDLEPMTSADSDKLHTWLEKNLPPITDYVSKSDVMPAFTAAFEWGVLVQYKHFGYRIKAAGDEVSFELTNTEYIAALEDQANYLLLKSSIDETTRNRLINMIEEGKKGALTVDELSAEIAEQFPEISDTRAYMIARTEVSNAMNIGQLASIQENGVPTKAWVAGGNAEDDICSGNIDDGFISADQPFSSGDDAPPGHPNCECYLEAGEIDLSTVDIWGGA